MKEIIFNDNFTFDDVQLLKFAIEHLSHDIKQGFSLPRNVADVTSLDCYNLNCKLLRFSWKGMEDE